MRVFNDAQRFNQWWLILLNLIIFGFLIYMIYNWFVLKEATGSVSSEDRTVQIVAVIVTLLSIGMIYIFSLKTIIDEICIHYQFLPINLSKKTIRWSEIKKCHVRTYSPIKEYGGWGYRGLSGKNKAVNVKGNQGIQLEFDNGNNLRIGTQKVDDAKKVIEKYFKTKNE